ncbi:hypothetical protein MCC93_11270 [Morococcus cerebrosus]|uniref:Uncharacterized protein n=1 Tax=Morococcus cerebrosus TaxID=1056807 RepID=A0A0C1GQH8_9NEIS|nr:hypothetical protein MCC93_11270 [Morococcus cerebrosus]
MDGIFNVQIAFCFFCSFGFSFAETPLSSETSFSDDLSVFSA